MKGLVCASIVVGAAASAACVDDRSLSTSPDAERRAEASRWSSSTSSERQVLDLFGLEVGIDGPFVPGRDLSLRVRSSSAIPVQATVSIYMLDLPQSGGDVVHVGSWGSLSTNRPSEHRTVIRYETPGYYRVIASARLVGSLPDSIDRRGVATSRTETMWILVDSAGGRLTVGYDSTAIIRRRALYGAYGPFPSQGSTPRARLSSSSLARSSGAISVFGTFKYLDTTSFPVSVNSYVPVKGGRVNASCIGRSAPQVITPDVDYPVVSYVGSNGTWSVTCPSGVAYEWDNVQGNIYPVGQYADVRNHNNASVASPFFGFDNDNLVVYAASNGQGYVLSVLEEYVPQFFSNFGRSRSKVVVRVHDTDSTYAAKYDPVDDVVKTKYTRTGNTLGMFTTLHEYAHAFHYGAIEQPASFSLLNVPHGFHYIESISGSFVEGFATFAAAFIGGSYFSYGYPGADYNLEEHTYNLISPDSVLGWRIEGAVAGFLYDLVDTPASPNTINNTSDGVDDDGANYSASTVADIMASGSLNGGARIDGVDQFIYCAEQTLSAQSLQHPTYGRYYFKTRRDAVVYTSLTVNAHALSSSVVRTTWLRNLFNQ